MTRALPYLVPSAPVWRLVRERQSAWGFSDEEMIEHLGLAGLTVVDTREWMGRPFAERILRRLTAPARATPGTLAAVRHFYIAETSQHLVTDAKRPRIADELRGVAPEAAAS